MAEFVYKNKEITAIGVGLGVGYVSESYLLGLGSVIGSWYALNWFFNYQSSVLTSDIGKTRERSPPLPPASATGRGGGIGIDPIEHETFEDSKYFRVNPSKPIDRPGYLPTYPTMIAAERRSGNLMRWGKMY